MAWKNLNSAEILYFFLYFYITVLSSEGKNSDGSKGSLGAIPKTKEKYEINNKGKVSERKEGRGNNLWSFQSSKTQIAWRNLERRQSSRERNYRKIK